MYRVKQVVNRKPTLAKTLHTVCPFISLYTTPLNWIGVDVSKSKMRVVKSFANITILCTARFYQ